MSTSLGQHLVDEILPSEFRGRGVLTKSNLYTMLAEIAKKYPDQYPEIVTKLKRLGDEIVTQEGISVGLDDIEPHYEIRNKIFDEYEPKIHAAKTDAEKTKLLIETRDKILDYTKKHTGTMGEMVRSGGRGNMNALMRTVGAPVLASNAKEHVIPWLIRHSFSEGLKPAEAWVAAEEARVNYIKTFTSVTAPGELGKIITANMSDHLVTMPDCKTTNGIAMAPHDYNLVDRHLVHAVDNIPAGTLITPHILQLFSKHQGDIIVRSPMTCEANHGVCQQCQGVDSMGKLPMIGLNTGIRASGGLSEPLVQFALNAKHGGRVSTTDTDTGLSGITGLRQIIEVPKSFLNKATLANHDGKVTKIEAAPQGGTHIWVNDTKHYISTQLKPSVKIGDVVEAGDALSNGIPKPDEIVEHKGLGAGRKYLVTLLHGLYTEAGTDIDKRHLETLAKNLLNHVEIVDVPPEQDHLFMKGDIVDYNKYQRILADHQKLLPLHDSHGETLAENVLHFTAGTRVTPSVIEALEKHNIKQINVATLAPRVVPVMKTAARNPLLNPDWMARLGHRYLKETMMSAAHKGETSDTRSYHPVPAYAAGNNFGLNEESDTGEY